MDVHDIELLMRTKQLKQFKSSYIKKNIVAQNYLLKLALWIILILLYKKNTLAE